MPKQRRHRQPKTASPTVTAAPVRQSNGQLDIAALASQLVDPQRSHPIVVVTVSEGQTSPDIDMVRLTAELPSPAVVHVIADHADTARLSRHLGDRYLAVYGGAVRTYPAGAGWLHALTAAPVRLPRQYPNRDLFTDAVLADVATSVLPAAPTAAGAERLPPLIDQPSQAIRLARHLLDPDRARTVVVVTRPSGKGAAFLDTADIRRQLDGFADVYEVANGPVGHALSGNLPADCSVYGGASRTYPARWSADPDTAPLRFVWHADQADRIADLVVSDAFHAARRTSARFGTAPITRPAAGRIIGIAGSRALVTLDGGGMAAIRPELTVDGVEPERLFAAGMRVEGLLDDKVGLLDVTGMIRPTAEALAGYQAGDTVLAEVMSIAADSADLRLFPGVTVRLSRGQVIDPSRPAPISQLLTVGETVNVAVMETADGGGWQLDLTMADPDVAPVAAPAILAGGPSWLIPADPEPVSEPDLPPAVESATPSAAVPASEPAPAPTADPALTSMTAERDQLLRDLESATARLERVERELGQVRTRMREAETALARARRQLGGANNAADLVAAEGSLFSDPVEQLQFEVQLAWARRIPAAEKAARPLGKWSIGPNFLDTLNSVEGVDRSKVVDVIVEIVTGMVHEIAGRELHQLRAGDHGDAPARVRADGATCWRVSLQVKTPSARRLHFWMLNDGSIELSAVRLHDDIRD